MQGGVPPRSEASSPESGTPIGPQPPHDPAAMAGSGLTGASGNTLPSCGIVSFQTLQYETPSTELPGHAPATGRGPCRSRMPARAPRRRSMCGWRRSMCLLHPYAMRPRRSGPYSMPLLGGSCVRAEVLEDVCRPREILVAMVVSEESTVRRHCEPARRPE